MSKTLIKAENVSKHFPVKGKFFGKSNERVHALDGINITVYENEIVGLVGESGSGKSTLARVLLRLLESTNGSIEFQGQDITRLSEKQMREIRKDMQIVFQDPFSSLNPRKKIKDIIAEPLDIYNIGSQQERLQRVQELLEIVGLNNNAGDRYPHQFSGGQRQRIGIARALALNPKLIICDEPVSALDVSVQAQILNLLQDLQEKFELTYIFIAHGLEVVRHISDRIIVMYLGEIVEIGNSEDVFTKPLHPYSKALISAIPDPNPDAHIKQETIKLTGEIPSPITPPSGCRFHTRCPFAMEKCINIKPELKEVEEGRIASCHLL